MKDLTFSIQEAHVGGAVGRAHRLERWDDRSGRPELHPDQSARAQKQEDEQERATDHGRTSKGAFGSSPNISGA